MSETSSLSIADVRKIDPDGVGTVLATKYEKFNKADNSITNSLSDQQVFEISQDLNRTGRIIERLRNQNLVDNYDNGEKLFQSVDTLMTQAETMADQFEKTQEALPLNPDEVSNTLGLFNIVDFTAAIELVITTIKTLTEDLSKRNKTQDTDSQIDSLLYDLLIMMSSISTNITKLAASYDNFHRD